MSKNSAETTYHHFNNYMYFVGQTETKETVQANVVTVNMSESAFLPSELVREMAYYTFRGGKSH